MDAHSITFVDTPRPAYFRPYPTFVEAEPDLGEGTDEPLQRKEYQISIIPTRPRRESGAGETEAVGASSTEPTPDLEDEDVGGAQSVNANRNEAFRRLLDLETFARSLGDPDARDRGVRSCRDAVTLLSFWPSDLVMPEADLDDGGTVSVEQFKDDGSLQAIFEFSWPNQATYAVLSGTAIVARGYVSTLDAADMTRVFENVRLAAGDRE